MMQALSSIVASEQAQEPRASQSDSLRPNYDAMLAHLQHLFGGDLGEYADGLVEIAWTTVSNGAHKLNKARLYGADQLEAAAGEALLRNQGGSNVYVGIALRKPGTFPGARASDDDSYCVTAVAVDLDDPGRAENAPQVWDDMPPTLAVRTGKLPHERMQLWWRLQEPFADFGLHRRVQLALASAFDGDTKIINASRVMRLAGSVAWPAKPGRSLEMTELVELKPRGTDIGVEDVVERFEQFMPIPGSPAPLQPLRMTPSETLASGPFDIGPLHDGRETYMRDTVLACLKQFIGENGCEPTPAELHALAWPQYERNVRVEVDGKVTRGPEEMMGKCVSTLGRFRRGEIATMRNLDEAIQTYNQTRLKQAQTSAIVMPSPVFPGSHAYRNIKPSLIKRREFLYGNHYIRKFTSATIAMGAAGKSSLTIVEALAMVTGRDLLGIQPKDRFRVWIWNGEDPYDELQRRIEAAKLRYRITDSDVEGWLRVDSGRDVEIKIASMVRNGVEVNEPLVQAIIDDLRRHEVDVIIVDPLVSAHAVPENDNNAVDAVVKAWNRVGNGANCSTELCHHSRKTNGDAVTVEDGRGASALLAGVRSARVLNVMTEAEAIKAGVTHRKQHIKLENGKANMSPPPEHADWYFLRSVPLGNGTPGALVYDGDMVAVVETWLWPDMLDGLTAEISDKAVAEMRRRAYRTSPQSNDWGGYAVADAAGLTLRKGNPQRPHNMARVRAWLDALERDGRIVRTSSYDDKAKRTVEFYEVADAA